MSRLYMVSFVLPKVVSFGVTHNWIRYCCGYCVFYCCGEPTVSWIVEKLKLLVFSLCCVVNCSPTDTSGTGSYYDDGLLPPIFDSEICAMLWVLGSS
jgi:hypothetical protein